jgi:hypothetical protein
VGKYVYIYYAKNAEDAGNAEAWSAWFGQLGSKLIDGGNPFDGGAQAVSKDGVMEVKDMPATGYSIVLADTMAEATKLTSGCPLLVDDRGTVCVYSALPM